MSVFLTPEGQPFYGGTYFPPTPRYGMPSFAQVLLSIADAWQNRREELVKGGQQLVNAIERQMAVGGGRETPNVRRETLDAAFQNIARDFDEMHGGWGRSPKFPQLMLLEFLLRRHLPRVNLEPWRWSLRLWCDGPWRNVRSTRRRVPSLLC